MNVVISKIVAVNPHIVRVALYTHEPNQDDMHIRDYELAIPIETFTVRNENEVQIDLEKFQRIVTDKVAEVNVAANLAVALNSLDLEWEIIMDNSVKTDEGKELDGKILAYGEVETRDNT